MIYSIILKPKFRNIIKTFVSIMVVAFSATLYSCETVYTENYTPEKFNANTEGKCIEVTSKTDSTIDLTDYDVTYREKYKDSSSVLLIEETVTPYTNYLSHSTGKLKKSIREIYLSDIKNIKVEKVKLDLGNTIIFSGVILVALAIIGIISYYIISVNMNIKI
jgi:hypothetical protein